MAIRYAVDLIDTERAVLRDIISKNKAKRSTIINAYILLKADRTCGWTNEDIAAAYEVSTKKVEQLRIRISKGFFAQPPRECSRWQRLGARRRAVLSGLARCPGAERGRAIRDALGQ